MYRILVVSATLLLALVTSAQQARTGTTTLAAPHTTAAVRLEPATAMESVNPERIRAHVKFLASDLLEGRGTGQRGGELAAEYIATQFALDGLAPAGDNGTYMQKVPLVGIETLPQTTIALAPEQGGSTRLALGADVVALDESQQPASDIDAPIVFVGYGIAAPEFHWDDYKDTDLRGKVLLMLVNEPPSKDPAFFQGKALTYYGRWTYKFEEAARRGALGALLVHKTEMASYGWNVVQTSWSGERSYLRSDSAPNLHLAGWITSETANLLTAVADTNLDNLIAAANSRNFRPVPLPVRLQARMVSRVRPFVSENVLAILPGADAHLKNQAVLYTAHFDHLGIRPDQPGDNIYNGAVDNATGCGVLLEIAHALAKAPRRPKRSVIFASVTAEEQGLLGSRYLGLHAPIKVGNINLALNFDGIAPIGVPEAVDVSGAERTTFYPAVKKIAREMRLALEPDPNPGAGYYYRSDHFSLARTGIPAFSIAEGTKFLGRSRAWGEAYERDYVSRHYHQPSDEYHDDWDFRGEAKIARFALALGWEAAVSARPLGWRAGDEFEAARRASQTLPVAPGH